MMSFKKEAIPIICALLVFCGCATGVQSKKYSMETYYQALHDTELYKNETLHPRSEKNRQLLNVLFPSILPIPKITLEGMSAISMPRMRITVTASQRCKG